MTSSGVFPPQFPKTVHDFVFLTAAEEEALLKAYGIPAKGLGQEQRVQLLAEFLVHR